MGDFIPVERWGFSYSTQIETATNGAPSWGVTTAAERQPAWCSGIACITEPFHPDAVGQPGNGRPVDSAALEIVVGLRVHLNRFSHIFRRR